MAGAYFFTSPRPFSPPSAESSNTIFHLVPNMRQTEARLGEQRAHHQCIDCGQAFHEHGDLVAHRINDDCTTADSSDVHWPGSGTAVARRAMGTIEEIPGQYVHPRTSAPRYSFPYLPPAMEQTPQSPIHLSGSETKPIDLNLMPSLSSLSNPVDDQNPIGNDPLPQLETNYRSSFDADDRKGKRVLVDLNEPDPYPGELLLLNDLNRNPDPDEENFASRHETDLAIRDLASPPSPYRNRERGLRPPDARYGNSDPAADLLGVLAHSRPAGATAAVVEDDNPMGLDITLHL